MARSRTSAVVSVLAMVLASLGFVVVALHGGAVPAGGGAANDDFADAVTITQVPQKLSESTVGATTQVNEPAPCGSIGSTVWYKFDPGATMTVVLNTFNSDYDTVLAAYTGTALPNLAPVACSDDAFNGPVSKITFSAVVGNTYWIQAGGSDGDQGILKLKIRSATAFFCEGGRANILGTAGPEFLSGGPGFDRILGFGGDDILFGFKGNDKLCGGAGDDVLDGGPGKDVLQGGPGSDFASYSRAPAGVSVNLNTGTATGGYGNDTLISIRHLGGSRFADTLRGNSQGQTILAAGGNDVVFGLGGADTIAGQRGSDDLFGGQGDDDLFGGSGNDDLFGGRGNDLTDGGRGIDSCEGETQVSC